MVNGKKLLASVLVGAMVITGSPVAPAWSVATVEAAEAAEAVIITEKGNKYPFDLTKNELQTVINEAKAGDTIEITGSYELKSDIEIAKAITIDLSKATISGAEKIKVADGWCENPIGTDKKQYAELVYTAENMTISFPEKYDAKDKNKHGVTAAYVMENGYTVPINASNITVTAENTVTCTKAGTATVTARVEDRGNPKVLKKEYKDQAALGHSYGEPAKDGTIAPKAGVVTVDWAIRGGVASKDENGYTKIESIKTACENGKAAHGSDVKLEEAKSAVIKSAVVKQAATSAAMGVTTYTIEVVTADDVTILVKADATDIPALEATTVGEVTKLEFLGYEYTKTGDTYTKKATPVYKNKISFEYLAASNNYKTEMAANGDITYRITYKDAVEPTKEGTITGTLSVLNDDTHKTVVNTCGKNTYYYPTISVKVTLSSTQTQIKKIGASSADKTTSDVAASNVFEIKTNGNHTVDMNDGNCEITTPATTIANGVATITCKHCGKEVDNAVVPMLTTGVVYEGKDGKNTEKDDIANAEVFTKKASCLEDGYDYYWVIGGTEGAGKDDGNGYTHKSNGVIRKIAGTETKATGHNLVLVNAHGASVTWTKPNYDSCEIEYSCHNCNVSEKIKYYAAKGTDDANNKYSAITSEVVKGSDCTKKDIKVFTVKDVKDALGKAVDTQIELTTVGAHNYTDTLAWADNCKSATVTRKCANESCGAVPNQNKNPITVAAKVVGVDNTDGTTTYTASLDDKVLETKTIYDLSKAEVIVNDGKSIDGGAYEGNSAVKAAAEKAVVVKINGAVIDSKLYTITSNVAKADNTYTVTVKPAAEAKDVIGEKTGEVVVKALKAFTGLEVKLDGKNIDPINYDGKAHAVVASVKEKDATVKYMVSKEKVDDDKIVYDADKAEITDVNYIDSEAAMYYVYYQISKEGYTTKTGYVNVLINAVKINTPISVDKATILYGESVTATTGDKDLDAKLAIKTVDTSKKSVGEYSIKQLVEYNKNYDVTFDINWIVIKPRNATIVLKDITKKYDGKALKPVYTVDGVLPGDDLDIQVSAVGGKEIKNVGTYKVIATANNANYVVEKTTATVVITKLANSISVKKASATVKVAKVKKAAQYFTMGATAKDKSTVVAKKVKGSAKLTVSSAGKVKVAKGTKKGTYTMYVKLTAKGSTNYGSATKTVKVTVKVK